MNFLLYLSFCISLIIAIKGDETQKRSSPLSFIESSLEKAIDFNYHLIRDSFVKKNQKSLLENITMTIASELGLISNQSEALNFNLVNSSSNLTITKYAHHLIIREQNMSLYTFKYDLILNSCGPSFKNLELLHISKQKGSFFDTTSIPHGKYNWIVEQLIQEGQKFTNTSISNEDVLFISLQPSLMFLSTMIIEEKLSTIRRNIPDLRIRYCSRCSNWVPYDDFAFLNWFQSFQRGNDFGISYDESESIYLGIQQRVVYIAYPLDMAVKSSEDDKIIAHPFCMDNVVKMEEFVQNDYYEGTIDKFTRDVFVYYIDTMKELSITSGANKIPTIKFPCYPKYYKENLPEFQIIGSADLVECQNTIQTYIQSLKNADFNESIGNITSSGLIIWPLEGINELMPVSNLVVNLKSNILENLFKLEDNKTTSFSFRIPDLKAQTESYCNKFLSQEKETITTSTNKDYLNSCLNALYINYLLEKAGFDELTQFKIKPRDSDKNWIIGLTLKNLVTFHKPDQEWFQAVQARAFDEYLRTWNIHGQYANETLIIMYLALIFLIVICWAIVYIKIARKQKKTTIPVRKTSLIQDKIDKSV